jgi:hypothetical protein
MPNIIQIMPSFTTPENGIVWGVIGLEEGGRLWFGQFEYTGEAQYGPAMIAWRPIESR